MFNNMYAPIKLHEEKYSGKLNCGVNIKKYAYWNE